MKQRIVLRVDMSDCEKSRKKAMKIVSGASGVTSVTVQGTNDQLVVLGEEIDTAELTRELRKKVGHTTIVAVQAAPPARPQQQHQQNQQQQSQSYQVVEYQNEMAPARRCECDIPNSGYCGFCRSMVVVAPSYYTPGTYGGYREDPDGCIIM